jgi:hypothetical protein
MKACLGETEGRIETSTEEVRADIKTDFEEMNATESEDNKGKTEAVAEQCNCAPCVKASHVLAAQQGRDSEFRGTPKGQTFEKRRRTRPECNNGIRDRGIREQLVLGCKKTVNEVLRQTLGLEIANRIVGSFIKLQRTSVWTLWRGRSPPKRKYRLSTA